MKRAAGYACALALLAASGRVLADDPDPLADRLARLEEELAAERERGEARDARVRELEAALVKTTDALARAQDRRAIEAEVEAYLDTRPAVPRPTGTSRLSIGAVIVSSYRATDLDGSPRANSFQVEERYLRLVYRFSDEVTARYYTDGSLAELEVHFTDLFQLNVGSVVVPFGQFNPRSFPDTFDTLSRPLLYLGDEDTFATPENNPRAVFRTIYTDTGVVLSGSRWRGDDQFYYAVFVTNGLVGTTDLGQGSSFADNNNNKQIGARLVYTLSSPFTDARLGFGISWMTGKYDRDDRLSYRFYGADFVYVRDGLFAGGGSLTIRGEYVYAPRETLYPTVGDPTVALNEASRVQGAYLLVELRLDERWMLYAEGDWMAQKGPRISGGTIDPANLTDVRARTLRYAVGIVRKFELGFVWKFEYSFWDFDAGAPDANRFATQLVVPF